MKIDEITRTRRQVDIAFDEPAAGAGPVARAQNHNIDQRRDGPHRRVHVAMPNVRLGALNSEIDDVVSDEQAMRNAEGGPQFTTGYVDPDMNVAPPSRNTENLPATISHGVRVRPEGDHAMPDFDPNWIKVKNLPGMILRAIRGIARPLFSQFTDYPLEEIEMMSTATHPEADVKRVMKWISVNGLKDDDASINLDQAVPGYGNVPVQLWRTEKADYLIMQDHGVYFVYTWPGGRGIRLNDPNRLRIDHAR